MRAKSEVTHKVGKLIKQFDQKGITVADFNALFMNAPIEGMQPEYEVEIGEITHATFFRKITVTDTKGHSTNIDHDFRKLTSDKME
jgi:hypothetical protein